MDTIEIRKKAVLMYLHDVSMADICKMLQCSRPSLYKWIKHYQSNPKGEWYTDYSRRPHTIHISLDSELENLIIKIRCNLEKIPYAQIGAISIQWELKKLGIDIPPVWTINRIIKKHGLVLKEKKPSKRWIPFNSVGIPQKSELQFVTCDAEGICCSSSRNL
jgi:transposase